MADAIVDFDKDYMERGLRRCEDYGIEPDRTLADGDSLAVFPPVGGG